MSPRLLGKALWIAFLCSGAAAQNTGVPGRPDILGVANIGLKTNNLEAARNFYSHDLGFEEPFTLDTPSGGRMLTFKVNQEQYIQVFSELKSETEDRLSHIAFYTTNAQQLRDYLAGRGVKVPDAPLRTGKDGNLSFMVTDPDGHHVEFVQYIAGSLHALSFGKFLPATRISSRIIHVGVTVADRDAADRFYKDILGFEEMWHGGMKDDRTDWVDMRVPNGTDWLEYMLNVHNPSPRTLGVMHHLALGVPNVKAAYQTLSERGMHLEEPQIGRDGKWQLNLYDPNLTRCELMEPKPVRTPCCSPFK